jgi:hypothetical protein
MEKERFVRWQRITREQFSAVSNLVLGLATALLAFQSSALTAPSATSRWLAVVSMLLLATSVALGLACAWNRLLDFRQTAQNARGGSHVDTEALGNRSWTLLGWQLCLFGLGALLVGSRILS